MSWHKAATLSELIRRPAVLKAPPRQVAVFLIDGRTFAIDNRCPHEGYPLAEGTIEKASGMDASQPADSCVLTCNWHNWKFRLADGECLLGGDHVRAYVTELRGDEVWVDLADPPPIETRRQTLRGLRAAFNNRDFGRICREITRLRLQGHDDLLAVREAVRWSHDRLEFGFTHAYAAGADWLRIARSAHGSHAVAVERRLICLAEAVDHMAFDVLRQPSHPYAAPADEPFASHEFLRAVENQDRLRAESLAARAAADGLPWDAVEGAFAAAALAHYNDFGHSLIYVFKAGQLLDLLGDELSLCLLPCLARHLAYTTREDLIPEFREYAPALAVIDSLAAATVDESGWARPDLFPASARQALRFVVENFSRCRPETLYLALLEPLARNLLHFDATYQAAIDRPVSDNVGWLDFTHGVTFANALRSVCQRHPQLWRPGLLQMALFLGRNRGYLDLQLDVDAWRVDDEAAFLADAYERFLDHGLRDPIFSAHLVKTAVAVEEELPLATPGCREALLAGLNRFLHSPLKQKHVRRSARQAIELVQRDFGTN